MFKLTFKEPDMEVADLVGLARSYASKFHVFECFGLPVVVRL